MKWWFKKIYLYYISQEEIEGYIYILIFKTLSNSEKLGKETHNTKHTTTKEVQNWVGKEIVDEKEKRMTNGKTQREGGHIHRGK
jgi:predicted transcriptional regulator